MSPSHHTIFALLWLECSGSLESYLLKFSDEINPEQKKSLQDIKNECKHLLDTVNDFLLIPSLEAKGSRQFSMREGNIVELIRFCTLERNRLFDHFIFHWFFVNFYVKLRYILLQKLLKSSLKKIYLIFRQKNSNHFVTKPYLLRACSEQALSKGNQKTAYCCFLILANVCG